MNILHGDFRLFGDNQVGNIATMVFAIATRGRSDSGPGDAPAFRHGAKILRAGADLLTRRIFGLDFDGCRTFGRYLLARASARFSSHSSSPPGPLELSVSSLRRWKTNLAPSLPPKRDGAALLRPASRRTNFPHTSAQESVDEHQGNFGA
jgi:hypothetical protein